MKVVSKWMEKKGGALDMNSNQLESKAVFALKVWIPWKSIFPYIHTDKKKLRKIGDGTRGKTNILDSNDIDFIGRVCARVDR